MINRVPIFKFPMVCFPLQEGKTLFFTLPHNNVDILSYEMQYNIVWISAVMTEINLYFTAKARRRKGKLNET